MEHNTLVKEETANRNSFYAFFARAFLEPPDEEFIAAVKEFVPELETDSKSELVQEYQRLFRIPYKSYVTPYESVFRNGSSRLWGESTINVKQFYCRFKFNYAAKYNGPPDHIGLELAFMACLCEEEEKLLYQKNNKKKVEKLLSAESAFLKEHLLKWVPMLKDKICKNASCQFYKTLSSILLEFLESEAINLSLQ
ncbi:MAG: molecular chaperone TorD family protein [Candidatus Schekmanbacteria bacterium]|nr:molecular chaperone TorD family protein [Candidatus Schekmanbacteria bacterium]